MTGDRPSDTRRRRADLGPEDRALWDRVTRDATPLPPTRRDGERRSEAPAGAEPVPLKTPEAKPAQPAPAPLPASPASPTSPAPAPRRLRPTGSGKPPEIGLDLAGPAVGPVGRPEAGLDRRLAERLRRGEREPDGRIDLHGMTAERAHRALDQRIGEALAHGERLVLVITGKGGKRRSAPDDLADALFMRDDQGVLRQQAPGWLRRGPHARHIVGIYEAPLRHGGAGAFYVYLKKPR